MALKNLSSDIEIAIKNSIEGMTLDINLLEVSDDKLEALMKSRQQSFTSIKELILLWQNSPNAPSDQKLAQYIKNLIISGENSIDILRQALRKKIDFGKLNADKHGSAIASKPAIFRSINEINSGVVELKTQLDSGIFDFKERDFKIGYPERFADQEFYPSKNYHKEWYDEETDSVMICPLGTKGEIINIDGLNIMLPAPPANKSKILFSDLSQKDQCWSRIEVPVGLTKENEQMYTDYILEEFKRRREGVWFMNNGIPTYLTPAHYMGLQWNQMSDTGGYKDFRYAQAKMYYFAKACLLDSRSVGMFFVKGRRTGFTEMVIDHFIDESTSNKNWTFGITSKLGDDAEVVFQKYQYVVRNLPFFFQPVVKGKIDAKNDIEFGKPSDNTRESKKRKDTSTDKYLNNKVNWRNTTVLSYDSTMLKRYLGDEAGKWKDLNYIDHWNNIKPTMVQGGRVVGKAFIGSTVNPLAEGGANFQILDEGSDIGKRNANGRTATGLYSMFLPAHKNHELSTDKYGVCHEVIEKGDSFINATGEKRTVGSLQFLEAEFASAKKMGNKAHNNARRLDPITKDDAFRDELRTQLFDTEKINSQIKFNNETDVKNKLLTRGNFEWKGGQKDTEVIFVPDKVGKFLIAWIPSKDYRNKWEMKPGPFGTAHCKYPLLMNEGAFGCDSYDHEGVVDAKLVSTENGTEFNLGSRGALHGLTGVNIGEIPSNFFFLEYVVRPKSLDEFNEDVLMACVFYSMPIMAENNKKTLLRHFKARGYRGYSLNRHDKEMNRLSADEKELGGIPSRSEDVINMHWTGIEQYISNFVGEYEPLPGQEPIRQVGEIGNMYFNKTLSDWNRFDPQKRTKFDASISSGYAILAINRNKFKPKLERKKIVMSLKTYS
jgi:hypothetical protein